VRSSRPGRPQASADIELDNRPARVSKRMRALRLAIVLSLSVSGAHAIEAQTTPEEGSSAEVPLVPIVIESDALSPPPGRDELMSKFREALGQPPDLTVAEHQVTNGPLEITTRFGRLCAEPPPAHLESGLGGDITLAAPCALF
jgi:hypothetical protein